MKRQLKKLGLTLLSDMLKCLGNWAVKNNEVIRDLAKELDEESGK